MCNYVYKLVSMKRSNIKYFPFLNDNVISCCYLCFRGEELSVLNWILFDSDHLEHYIEIREVPAGFG